MECPNCYIEYDLYEELYDDNRNQVHEYYGCSVCGHTIHVIN